MFQLPQSKIKFGALFFFAGLMLTASCTQNIKNDASISPGKSQAIIFYTANRYLELEPCGCEINPRGGLEREWTLRQLWQSQLKPGNHWVFGNGTTFIPENYDPKRQALYDVKSKYLVEAYNALETSALGLSPEDFNSGIEKMRSLAAAAKFPFVTSNILDKATHRPVFAPFIELDHGRRRERAFGCLPRNQPGAFAFGLR
jgi:2',3'-cyclic-nucleotide 2'-phosphodiesterase (5'-nucleotidase family)